MPQQTILRNGAAEATVSSLGAELMSWRMAGRELIWNGDERWWPRRAPTLFPFNGWLNGGKFRAKGAIYPTEVHGFGRDTDFSVERSDEKSVRLRLVDTIATRRQFPFAFDVAVEATLAPDGMDFSFAVGNPGPDVLPYSIGFHPGFVWPFAGGAKEDYRVVFDRDEAPDAPRIAPGGLFTREQLPGVPLRGRELDVARALQLQDAICFLGANSRRVDFVAPDGPRIIIETEGFPNWVVWSKPGGAYLCIEGWSGHGDPVGFEGDVTEKPGMTLLPPGESRQYRFRFRLA